jgi:uncharacterized protein (DUF1810 family)
MLCLVDC